MTSSDHGGMGQICHAMSRQNRGAIRTRSQRLIPTQHLRISGYTYGQITWYVALGSVFWWILSFHQHTFENTTESQTCNETSIKCGIMWKQINIQIGIPGIPQWDITATVTSLGWAAWLVRLQGVSSSTVSRRHHQPQQIPWLRKKRAKNRGRVDPISQFVDWDL